MVFTLVGEILQISLANIYQNLLQSKLLMKVYMCNSLKDSERLQLSGV